jgi:hypothetical protein
MNRTELMNACYKIRNAACYESDKIEKMRAIAKEMVKQDQVPYVVFHWSESPRIKMDVQPFKVANARLFHLNCDAKGGDTIGYFKTKLDIYFPDADTVAAYECLRYDIGCDEDDLIDHIKAVREYGVRYSDEEIIFLDKTINVLAKVI